MNQKRVYCATLSASTVLAMASVNATLPIEKRVDQIESRIAQYEAGEDYGNLARSCPQHAYFFISGDFLYWKATLDGLEYAIKLDEPFQTTAGSYAPLIDKVKRPDFEWGPGFRVGIGGFIPSNGWSLSLNWTRFYQDISNHFSHTVPDEPGGTLESVPGIVSIFGGTSAGVSWQHAKIHWDFFLNTLDFQVERTGYTHKNFTFAPGLGIKSAWISQKVNVGYRSYFDRNNGPPVEEDRFYDSKGKIDYFGVGPRFNCELEWIAGKGIGFFGLIAGSLLWGSFDVHRDDSFGVPTSPFNPDPTEILQRDHFHRINAVAEGTLGVRWQTCFYHDRLAFELSAGYEAQYWWNQNQWRGLEPSRVDVTAKAQGPLTMQGLTVNAKFDF